MRVRRRINNIGIRERFDGNSSFCDMFSLISQSVPTEYITINSWYYLVLYKLTAGDEMKQPKVDLATNSVKVTTVTD